jgi:hypothetical protein
MIDFAQASFVMLNHTMDLQPFDCGDADLNGFLLDDALHYLDERMAVTYPKS